MRTSAPLQRGILGAREANQHSEIPLDAPQPWLYACPRCCAQSTTQAYIGPTQEQLLRKQHRKGCTSKYKVLIGQLPLPAAQLQVTNAPIARDQTSVLVLMLQRSEAAALLVRSAMQALNVAGDAADVRALVSGKLETAVHLLTGDGEPMQAQYADFSGEKPRRLCNNCAQPASAHPVEITREGRRLVCILRLSDEYRYGGPGHRPISRDWPAGSTLPHATFTVTETGRAALAADDL